MTKSFGGNQQDVLRQRLTFINDLPADDVDLLDSLRWDFQDIPARTEFVSSGDRPSHSCLLIEGITSRFIDRKSGQRQIQLIHIPGDMPDLLSLHLKVMDHSLLTISPCRLAFVSHLDLGRVCAASHRLNIAFWRETLIDAAMYRAAVFRLGGLSSTEKLAHFICEITLRMRAIGLVQSNAFSYPVTQELIGEHLDLSTVSVNRGLQSLRHAKLVRISRDHFEILDWEALIKLGQFDPVYLHQNE